MSNQEIWKDIEGYEGLYQISNLGRIKSLSRKLWNGAGFFYSKERILKPSSDKEGYMHVGLHKDGKAKMCKVHRLVAIHFIPNPSEKPEINHIDGNKENNCIWNLEWSTRKENAKHAYDTGLLHLEVLHEGIDRSGKNNPMFGKCGNKHPRAKAVKCITTGEKFGSVREAARYYHLNCGCIARCCKGGQKYAGIDKITNKPLLWEYL